MRVATRESTRERKIRIMDSVLVMALAACLSSGLIMNLARKSFIGALSVMLAGSALG